MDLRGKVYDDVDRICLAQYMAHCWGFVNRQRRVGFRKRWEREY